MDWFELLTGFREEAYAQTKARFELQGENLLSLSNSSTYRVGQLELPTLGELRTRLSSKYSIGQLDYSTVLSDVRSLHRASANRGALFQVASQFNLLEMVGPNVSPEDGVTRYEWDHTQGPACAIAAGAATIYRNYFAPVEDQSGQTSECQLDALKDVKSLLARWTDIPEDRLWRMQNGYPMAHRSSLEAVNETLRDASEDDRDLLRSSLRIGLHWNVEVTDSPEEPGSIVSQAFCSAIPVSYSRVPADVWEPLARLVLEAAYEAAFTAGALNVADGDIATLYLTRLGGGAFGNPTTWIDAAIQRSLDIFSSHALRVRLVKYR